MKRLIVLILFSGALLGVKSYGQCDFAFDKACSLFQSGRYKEARMQFEWCKGHCKDRSESTYTGWINKCDEQIQKQDAIYQQKRRAAAEAIKKKEKEATERKMRVERNRYIFLSVNCVVKGNLSNIEYELEGDLGDRDSSLHFTSDSLEAYWFVRVLVNGYGDKSNDDEQAGDHGVLAYFVEADIVVENAATTPKKPAHVVVREGVSSIPEDRALEFVGNKIYNRPEKKKNFYDKIVNEIVKKVK